MTGGHGDEELGIPGHAGKREASKRFQRFLAEAGCSFEAEGDTTRLVIGGSIVEVKDEPGGVVIVEASVPLPTSVVELEAEREGCLKALELVTSLGKELEYSLDTSLPGYPVLRARVAFKSLEDAYNAIYEAVLERGCK